MHPSIHTPPSTYLGLDEPPLEVRVDGAGRLWRQRASRDGPAAHFRVAGREELCVGFGLWVGVGKSGIRGDRLMRRPSGPLIEQSLSRVCEQTNERTYVDELELLVADLDHAGQRALGALCLGQKDVAARLRYGTRRERTYAHANPSANAAYPHSRTHSDIQHTTDQPTNHPFNQLTNQPTTHSTNQTPYRVLAQLPELLFELHREGDDGPTPVRVNPRLSWLVGRVTG